MSKEKTLKNSQIYFQIQSFEQAIRQTNDEKLKRWYERKILRLKSLLI